MMEVSKDVSADGENNSPDNTLPPSCHASSTPCNTEFKPDVAELFEKMGRKLGWFQYGDINTAIKSLSRSAKKKSSKSRCRPDVTGDQVSCDVRECESSKQIEQDSISASSCKPDPTSNGKQKLSFSRDDSIPNIKENMDLYNTDSYLKFVPVRKSKATTDLTKEQSVRVNKLSLSAKKKQKAVKTPNPNKENLSPEIVPVLGKTKKKTVRISMIPHEIDVFELGGNPTSKYISKSSSNDRLSVGDVLMDDPVLESTRIHSRESMGRYLPSTCSNLSSVDELDVGEPLKESTRIHSRESIAKYLPSIRNSIEDGEIGQSSKESKESLFYIENPLSVGNPVQESTRLFACRDKGLGSRNKKSVTDDISAIRNNDTSISLCFNASDTTDMDDDSYKYLKIPCNTLTNGKLSVDSCTYHTSSRLREADHQGILVNCTELYTTAVDSPEKVSHNTVFHTVCESDQSEGSETDNEKSGSSFVPVKDQLTDNNTKSEHNNDNFIGSVVHHCQSVSLVEVKDMSLQTSMQAENISVSEKNEEKVSYHEVKDFSGQIDNMGTPYVSKASDKSIHNSSIGSRKSSSGSSFIEVEDAGLQTSHYYVDHKGSLGSAQDNESELDSFDDNLYKSVTMGTANVSGINSSMTHGTHGQKSVGKNLMVKSQSRSCNSNESPNQAPSNTEKSQTILDEDLGEDKDSDTEDYIPLKDRIKGKNVCSTGHGKGDYRDEPDALSMQSEAMKEMNSDDYLPDLEVKKESERKSESAKWRSTKDFNSESSEDDLEMFFQKMRTPAKDKPPIQVLKDSSKSDSMDEFIDDNDVTSGSEDELFYITTTSKLPSPKRSKKPDPVICLSSDEEDGVFKTPKVMTNKKVKTPRLKTPRKPVEDFVCDTEERFSFLKSLSTNIQDDRCNRDALRFKKNFKKVKEELTQKLFALYNESIFDNQLPKDLNIIWNKRLLRTAGYCVYKKNAAVKNSISVRVELSTKVCDSTERVRDTLIHELCHAAVWLLHGRNDGHGPYWRLWAQKANLTHPELPVINRCHSYSIATKYTYQCSKCGYQVGRHSKSLDTKRKVCGYCHGEFVLLSNKSGSGSVNSASSTPATPRAPNKFALFVKENYGKVKGQQKDLKHGDIMKVLSKDFAEKNRIT